MQSPFTESQQLVCIVVHLYWTVTCSGTTQIKLKIISQVTFIPCLSPKTKVSGTFKGDFVHLVVSYDIKWHSMSFFFFIIPLFCDSHPVLGLHPGPFLAGDGRFDCICKFIQLHYWVWNKARLLKCRLLFVLSPNMYLHVWINLMLLLLFSATGIGPSTLRNWLRSSFPISAVTWPCRGLWNFTDYQK